MLVFAGDGGVFVQLPWALGAAADVYHAGRKSSCMGCHDPESDRQGTEAEYDDYCFVRLSMKYGAFDYLLKPIDKHEFLSVVRLMQQSELIEQGKLEPNANSLINSAKNYIRKHYANKLTMVQAADYVHLNPSYFSKLFRSKTGVTFTDYLTNVRITQAKQLLLNTDDRICDICLNVGFSDNVTFNRAFWRVVGVSPTDYRNQFSFAEHDGDAD